MRQFFLACIFLTPDSLPWFAWPDIYDVTSKTLQDMVKPIVEFGILGIGLVNRGVNMRSGKSCWLAAGNFSRQDMRQFLPGDGNRPVRASLGVVRIPVDLEVPEIYEDTDPRPIVSHTVLDLLDRKGENKNPRSGYEHGWEVIKTAKQTFRLGLYANLIIHTVRKLKVSHNLLH
jgi:hypothetical protein